MICGSSLMYFFNPTNRNQKHQDIPFCENKYETNQQLKQTYDTDSAQNFIQFSLTRIQFCVKNVLYYFVVVELLR